MPIMENMEDMNQLHNADDIHKHSDMQRTMRSTEFDFDQQTVNYYGYSYNLELPGSILRSLSAIYSNTTFSLIAQFSSTTPNCLLLSSTSFFVGRSNHVWRNAVHTPITGLSFEVLTNLTDGLRRMDPEKEPSSFF